MTFIGVVATIIVGCLWISAGLGFVGLFIWD
mgnify:CR=1 FL=1